MKHLLLFCALLCLGMPAFGASLRTKRATQPSNGGDTGGLKCMSNTPATINGHDLPGSTPTFVDSLSLCCNKCLSTVGCLAAVYNDEFLCTLKNVTGPTSSSSSSTVVTPDLPSTPAPDTPAPTNAAFEYCLNVGPTCHECNNEGTPCAWCQTSMTCVPAAGEAGPLDCPQLIPASKECPSTNSPCQQGTAVDSCRHCVSTIWNCGWCEEEQNCFDGNATGPYGRTCKQGWSFGNTATSCPLCGHRYGNCKTCAASPHCGWCPNTNDGGMCLAGNATGPFSPQYGGAGQPLFCGIWVPPSSTCPASYNTFAPGSDSRCNKATTCDECTAMSHSGGGCGWCNSTQQCYYGSSVGPNQPNNCDQGGWQWKTCVFNCSKHTTCDACASDDTSECGWCAATQKCQAGTHTGPFTAEGCPKAYWGWGSYQCLDCSSNNGGGCSYCTETTGCGWCHATQTCAEGSPSGPFSKKETCPIGNWTFENYLCP